MLLFNKPTAISYISKSGDKIYPVVIDIKEGVKSSETLSFMTADSNTGILSVAFMEGETIYNIDDATVVCDIERPDGTDLSIGAVKVADGVVEVPLGVNGTSQPGVYMFDFKIVRPESKTIGVPLVSYTVTQSINTDEIVAQDDRLPVLNDLMIKIQNATSASTQATNECKTATNNANNTLKSVNNAIASGTVDLELKQLRTSLNGTLHPTANDRINQMETHLLETTATNIETESSFTTVGATNNGYFEDVKLEGKTLVNRTDIFNKVNLTGVGVYQKTNNSFIVDYSKCGEIVKACSLDETNVFKSGQIYTIIIDIMQNTLNQKAEFYPMIWDFATVISGTQYVSVGEIGRKIFVIKANKDYSLKLAYASPGQATQGVTGLVEFKDIMVLDGDYTNKELPSYFEGLMSVGQDVEEVGFESVNSGNLFDGELELGGFNIDTGAKEYTDPQFRSTNYISVKPNTTYTLTQPMVIYGYDKTYKYIKSSYISNKNVTFTTHSNCHYIRFRSFNSDYIEQYKDLKLMLVEGTKPKVYTPHQSNKKPLLYYNPTTETWEKPILREWDTIEKHSDGKYYYHKRSEEVVFNGSENGWSIRTDREMEDTQMFTCNIGGDFVTNGNDINLISDKFNSTLDTFAKNVEGFYRVSGYIYIRILKSKLSTQDVAGFKSWLQANPITVVYQIAQEKIYECTNIDLMTYSGETNYIINSGAISPKSLLKVHNNLANVVKILQEKVNLLENTFIAGLKSVLSGDMYALATILYPEDFIQNDNTEQDIMVIPE